MKNIKEYLTLGMLLGATTIFGCKENPVFIEKNMPQADGHDVIVEYVLPDKDRIVIRIGRFYGKEGFLGEKIYAEDFNGDGRIDRISLDAINGSSLEELASVEKIGQILKSIKKKNNLSQ